MPDAQSHVDIAVRNVELACHLHEDAGYHDWAATVAFYAALHVVDALLASENPAKHGGDHARRESEIKGQRRYHTICKQYRVLKGQSTIARYMARGRLMQPSQIREVLLKRRLRSILHDAVDLQGLLTPPLKSKLMRAANRLGALASE